MEMNVDIMAYSGFFSREDIYVWIQVEKVAQQGGGGVKVGR